MNLEFTNCLKRGKISTFSRGKQLFGKELEVATFDLKRAQKSFQENDYKWSTVQAYYSMFHSAKALLFLKNYREKSHYCLIEALKTLYTDEGLLDLKYVKNIEKAKLLRESADYSGDYSKEAAQELIKNTQEFYKKTREIIKNNNV